MVSFDTLRVEFGRAMKIIDLLTACVAVALGITFRYWQFAQENVVIVLCALMLMLALTAIDCNCLNYYHFHKNKPRQVVLAYDTFVKFILTVLIIPYYAAGGLALTITIVLLGATEIVLYFITRRWIGESLVYKTPEPTEENVKTTISVMAAYSAYLGGVCFIYFPDFSIARQWCFVIPLALCFFAFARMNFRLIRPPRKNTRLAVYCLLYWLSLTWFAVTRYVFAVTTPISLFTLIGLIIMLPYFIYSSRIIKSCIKNDE